MLQAKTADPETVALVKGATSGMVTTIEQEGIDAVAEWEVKTSLNSMKLSGKNISSPF